MPAAADQPATPASPSPDFAAGWQACLAEVALLIPALGVLSSARLEACVRRLERGPVGS
jgi:hypothetical protein